MPKDDRSLIQKLEAVIAPDSGATDGERSNAADALAKLRAVPAPRKKATRGLTREAIAAAPGQDSPPRWVKVKYPDGRWVTMDEDMVSWEMVDSARLDYRIEGESMNRQGRRRMKQL